MPLPTINNALAHAILDGYDDAFDGGVLQIRTGAGAGAANAASGTLLAELDPLGADFMAAASGRVKAINAADLELVGLAPGGVAGHWRLISADGTMVKEGTVTATGGGGHMTLDNTTIAEDQAITITAMSFGLENAAS